MKLREIVVETAVLPTMEATKRDDAINELLDALITAGAVKDEYRESFRKAILARERKGSTGFGHGVAVPISVRGNQFWNAIELIFGASL